MTRIIGKPQGYAASVPLKLVIREDIPYRSPEVGISAGTYEGTWNGADWGIDVLMPRWNKEDAMSLGGVHAFVSRTDTGQVVARYTYMPSEWVETTDGTFDLGAPVTQRRWIETQAIRDLMHNMEAATIYVTQVARDLLARGGSLPAGGSAGQVLTRTTTGYEWANGGTGGQEMTYTPTKKRAVTATHNLNGSGTPIIRVPFETNSARADGADIRIYNSASELVPHAVLSAAPVAGGYRYVVAFSDDMTANESKTYTVKYGDPAARYPALTQEQLQQIDFGDLQAIGTSIYMYGAREPAPYVADVMTAGSLSVLSSIRDSGVIANPLPDGGSVVFAGQTYNAVNWNANAGLQFGTTQTSGGTAVTPPPGESGLFFGYGDWGLASIRMAVLPNGYEWYIRHGQWSHRDKMDSVITYTHGGKWTYSVLRSQMPLNQTFHRILVAADGAHSMMFHRMNFSATAADQAQAFVIEPAGLTTPSVAAEQAV